MTTTHDHATDKVRWEEMLPDQLLHAIQTRRVCYMAYGLAEPHGPYNALGLDFIKAQGLCELAARAHGAVVAPPFCWHIQERPSFPWMESHGVKDGGLCSSIPTDLFFRMVMFNLRAIDARGFQAAILITGHYGGVELDLRLVCDYYLRRTGSPLRIYAIADCEVIRHERYRGDHAGMTENSQLMAIRPDLVDLSRNAKGWPSGGWCGTGFPTGDGATPSRELSPPRWSSARRRIVRSSACSVEGRHQRRGARRAWRIVFTRTARRSIVRLNQRRRGLVCLL